MAIEIKPYEPSPLEQQKQVFADALRAAGYGDDDNYRVNELAEGLTTLSEFLPGFGDVQGMREGKYLMEQGAPYVGGAVVGLSMLPFVPAGRIVRYFRDRGLLPRPKPTEASVPEQLEMSLPEPSLSPQTAQPQPTRPQTTPPRAAPTRVITQDTSPDARMEARMFYEIDNYFPGDRTTIDPLQGNRAISDLTTVGEPNLVETLAEKSILGNKNFQNPNKKYNVNNLINSTIATVKEGPARENLKRQLDDFIPQELKEGKATIQEVLDAIGQNKPTIVRNIDSRMMNDRRTPPNHSRHMPYIPTDTPARTYGEALETLMPLKYSEESYSIHSPIYGDMFRAPGHPEVSNADVEKSAYDGMPNFTTSSGFDSRNNLNRIYTSRSGLYDIGGEKVYIPAEGQSGIYGFDSPEKIKTQPRTAISGPYTNLQDTNTQYRGLLNDIDATFENSRLALFNDQLLEESFMLTDDAIVPEISPFLKEGTTALGFQLTAREGKQMIRKARNDILANYNTDLPRFQQQELAYREQQSGGMEILDDISREEREGVSLNNIKSIYGPQLEYAIPNFTEELERIIATRGTQASEAAENAAEMLDLYTNTRVVAGAPIPPNEASLTVLDGFMRAPKYVQEDILATVLQRRFADHIEMTSDINTRVRDITDEYSSKLKNQLEGISPDKLGDLKAPPLASDWFSLHMKTSLNRAVQEGADKVHFPVNDFALEKQRAMNITFAPPRAQMYTTTQDETNEIVTRLGMREPTFETGKGTKNMADTYRRQTNKGLKQIEAEYGIKVPTTKYVDENKNEFIEITLTPELKKAFSKIVYSRGGPVGPMMPLKYVENRRDTSPDFRKEIQEARMDARREMREKDIGGPYDVVGLFDDATGDKFRNPITMMAADLIDNLERAQELNRYAKRTDPQMNIGQMDEINMAKTGDLSFDLGGKLLPEYARTTTAGEQPFDLFLNINQSRAIPGRPFDDSGTEYELQARMLTDPEREAAFFDKVGGALNYTGIPFLEDKLRGGLEALYSKLDPESYEANRRGERIRSYLDE